MNIDERELYILENINELRRVYRVEVLQLILGSNVEKNKIREKGNGTEIRMSDLSHDIINVLYNYIKTKMTYQANELSKTEISVV